MNSDDFEKQPRGPRLVDLWLAKQPLASPISRFEIELGDAPDPELLSCANQLAEFVANNCEEILDFIYERYRQAAEQEYWMRGCGVPTGLARRKVSKYIRRRSINVRRDRKGTISGVIVISPLWDTEHGIVLGVQNGIVIPL